MPYFPKSRIIENQKANPGEMQTSSGKEYTGPYYITFDGEIFSGANPYAPGSKPLTKSLLNKNEDDSNISPDFNNDSYQLLKPTNLAKLTNPTSFTPKPTQEDYKRGKITRYFARQRNGTQFKILEINQTTYDNLSNNTGGLNTSLWKVISIFWQISGPLRDERINNIRTRAGVIDTNQRILDNAEKNFIGIKQYLIDLRQFSIYVNEIPVRPISNINEVISQNEISSTPSISESTIPSISSSPSVPSTPPVPSIY